LILDARVAVEDPDSSWVQMTLEEAPQGMVLARRIGGGLEAQLEWTPSPAQLNGPIAPTFFAVAEDGDHEPVRQRMSVVIKRAPGWEGEGEGEDAGCPRGNTAPTLEPVPIEDSCGADKVVIEAAIRNAKNKISDAFLSYGWHDDPGNFPCYISASLLPGEEDASISSIPSASALVG
jgi:hypothetical protein